MTERRDFLSVCNDQGVPLPDFQATFCVRCVQPECSRSKAGGLFESRVATWQERLFVNPPRMAKDDPLYAVISAKKFRDIDVGGAAPSIGRATPSSSWVDPLASEEPTTPPKPRSAPRRPAPVVESEPEKSVESVPTPQSKPSLPVNTPFSQGTMIGGAAPSKPVDPWALDTSQVPPPSGGTVIRPGAKIRFRGGSK
jgi:hypothetical protein